MLLLRSAPLLTAVVIGACVCSAAPIARAQTTTPTKQLTPNQAQAEQHFQRAKVLYKAGSYREAITELEKAHTLDPAAKDLVLNLATVSEKVGAIDDALKYTHEYEQLDLTAPEKARADEAIHRLEGAKKEIDAQKAAQAAQQQQQDQHPPPPPPPPAETRHGRIDVFTIGAATVAVAGLAIGTVFGVKALSDKPAASGYVAGTGPGASGSYANLQTSADHSHSEARVADIAFIVGGVAAIGTAVLYFARTRESKPTSDPANDPNATPSDSTSPDAPPSPAKDDTKATSKKEPALHDAWLAPTLGGLMLGGSW